MCCSEGGEVSTSDYLHPHNNLLAILWRGGAHYMLTRDVEAGEELFVCYGDDYHKQLKEDKQAQSGVKGELS